MFVDIELKVSQKHEDGVALVVGCVGGVWTGGGGGVLHHTSNRSRSRAIIDLDHLDPVVAVIGLE